MDDVVILPKGTIVKLNGFPCELTADTEVVSAVLNENGLDWVLQNKNQSGLSERQPALRKDK